MVGERNNFYVKTGAWNGAEKLQVLLATFALVMNIVRRPPVFCSSNVDAKSLSFRGDYISLFFTVQSRSSEIHVGFQTEFCSERLTWNESESNFIISRNKLSISRNSVFHERVTFADDMMIWLAVPLAANYWTIIQVCLGKVKDTNIEAFVTGFGASGSTAAGQKSKFLPITTNIKQKFSAKNKSKTLSS